MVKVKTTITVTYENFPDEEGDGIMNYGLVIYAILIGHSDKEHPLKQKDIRQLLKEEYGYNVDRETVRRAIEDMQIYDLPIKCSLTKRSGSDFIMTDIYYDKELLK